jgi:hypothetical protein
MGCGGSGALSKVRFNTHASLVVVGLAECEEQMSLLADVSKAGIAALLKAPYGHGGSTRVIDEIEWRNAFVFAGI